VAQLPLRANGDYQPVFPADLGAPSFVTEPEAGQIRADPARMAIYLDYIRNIAAWLHQASWDANPAAMSALAHRT
jgi:hypothetical protein